MEQLATHRPTPSESRVYRQAKIKNWAPEEPLSAGTVLKAIPCFPQTKVNYISIFITFLQ
jgi:hypothetical protein